MTRRAACLQFPSRAVVVGGLFGYLADTEGLPESMDRVWASHDTVSAPNEWAAYLGALSLLLLAVDRAVERMPPGR